jgi:hypothetical protein
MQKIALSVVVIAALVFQATSAEAARRSSGRGGGLMAALGGVTPKKTISKGACDVKIDCSRYSITVNGESAGQIICASDTGARFRNKKVKLASFIQPASGAILPRGFPMLATVPMLCSNCYIHVYPWVGPSSRSLGCVGVTQKAWNKLTQCGGSDIAFVTRSGVASITPPPVNQIAQQPVPTRPASEPSTVAATPAPVEPRPVPPPLNPTAVVQAPPKPQLQGWSTMLGFADEVAPASR